MVQESQPFSRVLRTMSCQRVDKLRSEAWMQSKTSVKWEGGSAIAHNTMPSFLWWLSMSICSSTLKSKELQSIGVIKLLKTSSKSLTYRSTGKNSLAIYQAATSANFLLQSRFLAIQRSYFWMSHRVEWTPRLAASCGRKSRRFLSVIRAAPWSWPLIRWRRLRLSQLRWRLWAAVPLEVLSAVLEAHSISKTSLPRDTKFR